MRKTHSFSWSALTALCFILALSAINAIPQTDSSQTVRDNYNKREYLIPMRDGVHLFTAVYTPKDSSKNHPFLMRRTPYSVRPYGESNYAASLGPSTQLAQSGTMNKSK